MIEKNDSETRIIWDDFSEGLDIKNEDSKWYQDGIGTYACNDGVVTMTEGGIRVAPKGKNPKTGEPAFSLSLAQNKDNGGIPGALDHIKWVTYMNHTAYSGHKGFDVVSNKTLEFEAIMGGKSFGTHNHPFGEAVEDPESDLRLGAAVMLCADPESMMVFDMFVTNNTIYAFYERLPYGRRALGNYAAFSYQIPVASRKIDDIHNLKISYNKESNIVKWFVDGKEVFKVENVGMRIDRKYMTLDLGGEEEVVSVNQLNAGLGLFTLLDGTQPTGTALVKLTDLKENFDPAKGETELPVFVDNESKESSRLFGQGAELICNKYTIIYK